MLNNLQLHFSLDKESTFFFFIKIMWENKKEAFALSFDKGKAGIFKSEIQQEADRI